MHKGQTKLFFANFIFIALIFVSYNLLIEQSPRNNEVYGQTVENQIIENTLEKVEEATQGTKEAIEQANKAEQIVVVNETTSSNIEQLKPVSDEMLKYAEEIFPALNDPPLSREDKVKILNQLFTDPELFLQNWRNLRDSIDSIDDNLN